MSPQKEGQPVAFKQLYTGKRQKWENENVKEKGRKRKGRRKIKNKYLQCVENG
jgi:hypothetical protein